MVKDVDTIAFWAPVIGWSLITLIVLSLVSIVSDLSTGQNERRDRKAQLELEDKPRG
jgi:hypothetical protein